MTPDEERDFTVVDKRHGRESGPESEEAPAPRAAAPEPAAPPPPEPDAPASGPLPALDFSTFLVSLSTSALYHLGLVPEEEGAPPPPPNLPMAHQTIDILEILREKTQGNLEPDEDHLFESLLYELRMRYVEVQKQG